MSGCPHELHYPAVSAHWPEGFTGRLPQDASAVRWTGQHQASGTSVRSLGPLHWEPGQRRLWSIMPDFLPSWDTHDVESLREFARIRLIAVDLDGTMLRVPGASVPPSI